MRYTNPPLDAYTLLANLKDKGLAIEDEDKAIAFLGHVSLPLFCPAPLSPTALPH